MEDLDINKLRQLANSGNVLAMKRYASYLFQTGETQACIHYFQQAAEYGDTDSLLVLSKHYFELNQVEDYWNTLKILGEFKHGPSIIKLAHHYQALVPLDSNFNFLVSEEDLIDQFKQFTKLAAHEGDSSSIILYGHALQNGLWGFEQDSEMALDLYTSGNNASCLFKAAQMLYSGDINVKIDKQKALAILLESAKSFGHPALKLVGDLMMAEAVDPQDAVTAFQLYQQSADAGDADAAKACADCFLNGIGTQESSDDALYYYQKAVNGNNHEALPCLAKMIYKKAKDYTEVELGVSLFKKWISLQPEDVKKDWESLSMAQWVNYLDVIFEK